MVFTQTYSPIPEFDEDDDGALFDFQVTATQDEPFKSFPIYFRFVVTTKRLLANVLKTKHICYKLIWLGFPVLIVGTTDKAKRFHPFGIGVTSSETSTDFAFIFHAISKGVVSLTGTKYKPEVLMLLQQLLMVSVKLLVTINSLQSLNLFELCVVHMLI